ncbi:MAG: PilT/PilU family type 4a pilus ATPase [Actinomycetota bacterium]
MDVVDLLRYMTERGASDLHLSAGNVPFIRVDGELLPAAFPVVEADDTEGAAEALMPAHKKNEFRKTNEADFAHTLEGVGRFRVNVLRQRGTIALAIRRVASEGQTFAELNLPEAIQGLAEARRGLVLVTGPTGSGKTTTIASMIGFVNRTRRAHIVTIEDPIEVLHSDNMSVIWQREIGPDTESYGAALRQVLRQDPDVIFVGEIRDSESAIAAIQAAQTGHLVLSTMHTIDATETVSRVVELFPQQQHQQVRTSFAGALRGIISQRLLERIDGRGLIPAVEILMNTGRIYERILDPDSTVQIVDIIADSTFDGMQTFDQALVELVRGGLVAEEDARAVATNPHDFSLALGGSLTRETLIPEGV